MCINDSLYIQMRISRAFLLKNWPDCWNLKKEFKKITFLENNNF